MIMALRITTGRLGCRAYVDGYCGRATLVLSGVAAAAAVAGATGACPGRVPPPPPARPPPPRGQGRRRNRGPPPPIPPAGGYIASPVGPRLTSEPPLHPSCGGL